ncbi:NHL repeat-containing protein [Streptomyces sp. NPDC050516]|uniref:NHL repeat-containing protein n=1 Tax=Streptomyces sp. NPDC050516 TaxID=3365621 RepID=UPI0037873596
MATPTAVANGTITTVAGTGAAGYDEDGVPATDTALNGTGVATDRSGTFYIADTDNHRIRKVGTDGIIRTIAGTGTSGFSGDGGQATAAQIAQPVSVAVGADGSVYFATWGSSRVRKVAPDGIITTVAGGGTGTADGGRAVDAGLSNVFAIALDGAGNLYLTERYGHRVRKVGTDGVIRTIAGTGDPGYDKDDVPATTATLNGPKGLAVDGAGNLYIADTGNHRVRRVGTDGVIRTVAGTGDPGYIADGGPGVKTRLNSPEGLAVDGDGNLYIADSANHRVRRVDPGGTITTIAGTGTGGYDADGTPADAARLYFPNTVALDGDGNLYIGDGNNNRVRKVTGATRFDPAKFPIADLYGAAVAPHTVQRGQEFDVGARIRNRGPNTVDGESVTVVLTLADGLTGGPGTTGRRLTRTFPGVKIVPYFQALPNGWDHLDALFRVGAPETTPAGTYECTLEIQYSGELNLKDNTFVLPVTVVVPRDVSDETALEIRQETVPEAAPGQQTKFNVLFNSPTGQPVNPGVVTQRFTAPTGFVFTGQPSYGYYGTIHGVITGNLDYLIEGDGRILTISANPHVNTTTSDTGPLVYTIGIQALPGARPGVSADGSAGVGKHAPIQISGKVTGSGQDERALRVAQESVPQAAPGATASFNVEIRSLNDVPVAPGTLVQRFTAPTGFAFTGGASYGYYYVKPAVTGNLTTRIEDGGKTLVVESDPHVNTGSTDATALLYTLSVRALPDATPGSYEDGKAVIGRLAPVPLSGHIL